MSNERKGFNFYKSYFDVYNELSTNEDKVAFMDALLQRQFFGTEPLKLKGMSKFAYISQKYNIDAQVKGFEDKTKTKLHPPIEGGPEGGLFTPTEQEKEKGEVKVKVKVKEVDKEAEFKNSLLPYLDTFGKDLLNEFFLYWTEKSPKGKKMRFEMQKVFDTKRRLDKWKKWSKTTFKNNTLKTSQTDEALEQIKRLTGK